jgi:hypothetical protein
MKTKTPTIASLKFDYINRSIKKFDQGEVRGETRVFHFPGEALSSEVIIERMRKEGYGPANLAELLVYAKDAWNDKDWVAALGSVAKVSGNRLVPVLWVWEDLSRRDLDLAWWDVGWDGGGRFLGFRDESLDTPASDKALGDSDTLSSALSRKEALKIVIGMEEELVRLKKVLNRYE